MAERMDHRGMSSLNERKRKKSCTSPASEVHGAAETEMEAAVAQQRQRAIDSLLQWCRTKAGFRLNEALVQFTASEQGVRAFARTSIKKGTPIAVIPRSCYLWRHHPAMETAELPSPPDRVAVSPLKLLQLVRAAWDELCAAPAGPPTLLEWADVELAVLFMAAKCAASANENSVSEGTAGLRHWKAYLEALQPAPLDMPLAWDAAVVMAGARGTQFCWAHRRLQAEVARVWELALEPCCRDCLMHLSSGSILRQLFDYGLMIVMSHAFGQEEEEGQDEDEEEEAEEEAEEEEGAEKDDDADDKGDCKQRGNGGGGFGVHCSSGRGGPALVPVADLFNGMPEGQNSVEVSEVQVATGTPGSSTAQWATVVMTVHDVDTGDELLNSYGPLCSSVFLLKYGVLPETLVNNNAHEAAFLALAHSYAHCTPAQVALLSQLGYPPPVWDNSNSADCAASPLVLRRQDMVQAALAAQTLDGNSSHDGEYGNSMGTLPPELLPVFLVLTWQDLCAALPEQNTPNAVQLEAAVQAYQQGVHCARVQAAFRAAIQRQLAALDSRLTTTAPQSGKSGNLTFVIAQLVRVQECERRFLQQVLALTKS
mmetsp:Transcript_115155/g.223717  ORF Transcript_115155/g.223717 Transcript_115155/m.223717 type:complete len:596 (+) Transcript_115155:110-1897(+)